MPLSSMDSPRTPFGALSDVPEEPGSPSTTLSGSGSAVSTTTTAGGRAGSPSISISGGTTRASGSAPHHSHPSFRPQPSTSSLASLASASASVVSVQGSSSTSRPPLGRNSSGLRGVSSSSLRADRERDKLAPSDTASVAGASVSGVMASSSSASKGKRSKSPGSATIREKDREGSSHVTDKTQGAVATRGGRLIPGMYPGGPRYRHNPHLPAGNADPVPATLMYWSKAPVYGYLPTHGVRAHSATLVDGVAWIFGGCDEKGCFKDVWCFNTETMQWSHPETQGDIPPPCRAHTATLVDRKIVMIGGGEGPMYYNDVWVLDTLTRSWSRPHFPTPTPPSPSQPQSSPDPTVPPTVPPPRRAHTAVLYRGRIWVFGGGNGTQALNDLWTLEVGTTAAVERMKWQLVTTRGKCPSPRGYHTANLVGNVMVVMGGSDGKECFADIWCLNLDSLSWSQVKLEVAYRRLSHTATQVGSYLFIWGGHNGSTYTPDLLLFNLVALVFETRIPAGRPPIARGYHTAFLTDSRLFVFGGFNGNDVFDDVHILDLAGAAYLPQVTSFKIDVE